jgi:hypothetical protein
MNVVRHVALLVSLAVLVGCNALDKAGSDSTPPAFDLSGSWEVVATSTMNTGVVSLVEYNAKQNGATLTAPVQEVIFGTSATTLANCFGVPPGSPQGNVSGTVDGSSITGTFTETGPGGESASFSIQAPIKSANTFSGNFVSSTASSTAPWNPCADSGTFVATKVTPLSGTYTGQLTYPDGSVESMNLSATEDSAYNMTVTGTASGGQSDGPINLSGNVVGNLAELHSSNPPLRLFAWWDASRQQLDIYDDTGYAYGALKRQ